MVDDLDEKLRELGRATDDIRPTDAFSSTVVDGLEEGNPLARLATATDGLTLGDDFSESLMARLAAEEAALGGAGASEAGEDPLQRAARLSADLRPGDGFTDAVLAAIDDETVPARLSAIELVTGPTDQLARSARSGLFYAAFAAAACLLLSWYTQRDFDAQVMLQADSVMVEEAE